MVMSHVCLRYRTNMIMKAKSRTPAVTTSPMVIEFHSMVLRVSGVCFALYIQW